MLININHLVSDIVIGKLSKQLLLVKKLSSTCSRRASEDICKKVWANFYIKHLLTSLKILASNLYLIANEVKISVSLHI